VIARATTQAAPGVVAAVAMPEPEAPRDLLADLAQVTGGERVRLADLPARLRELAPGHGAYKTLTGVQLRARSSNSSASVSPTPATFPGWTRPTCARRWRPGVS
jgi:hypothetical protein